MGDPSFRRLDEEGGLTTEDAGENEQSDLLLTAHVRKTLVRPGESLKWGAWAKRTLELRSLQGAQPDDEVKYLLVWFHDTRGGRSTGDSFELQWNTVIEVHGSSQRQLVCRERGSSLGTSVLAK